MIRKIISLLAVVFLMVGISLLIVPQISNHINKQKVISIIEEFEKTKQQNSLSIEEKESNANKNTRPTISNKNSLTEKKTVPANNSSDYHIDFQRLYRDSVLYNEKLKTNQYDLLINEDSYQQASLNLQDYGILNSVYGYVSAPTIDLKLPIYLGGNDDNMALGAAHMTYTSLPIGGQSTNCVLAAHTGYIGMIFFDYIRNLQIGDTVEITNFWGKLSYKVIDKQIFEKYESSNCYIAEGKDLLTMITCANSGANRYYVICERNKE